MIDLYAPANYTGFMMKEAISSTICTIKSHTWMGQLSKSPIRFQRSFTKVIRYIILSACISGMLCGCQEGSSEAPSIGGGGNEQISTDRVQDLLTKMQSTVAGASKDALEALGPHAEFLKNLSADEMKKLFRWSYKVAELPPDLNSNQLQDTLNELGAENWECFSIAPSGAGIRVTCKKRPLSALQYLQYIPGM